MNAIKATFPDFKSANQVWRGINQASRYSGIEVSNGISTPVRRVYDSVTKTIVGVTEDDAFKMLKVGYTDLVKYDDLIKPLYLGSSAFSANNPAHLIPLNLSEKLAMQEVRSNPYIAKALELTLDKNPYWKATEGWQKFSYYVEKLESGVYRKIEIHFVGKKVNGVFEAIDDFKFKD